MFTILNANGAYQLGVDLQVILCHLLGCLAIMDTIRHVATGAVPMSHIFRLRAGEESTSFGVFNLAIRFAMLLASVIAGALWDAVGPRGTFAAGAGFAVLALVVLSKEDCEASRPR